MEDGSAAAGGSSEDELGTDERDDGSEEEEEGTPQDPAAKPLAPAVLKAPTAKQKPGKVLFSYSLLALVHQTSGRVLQRVKRTDVMQ